MPSVFGCLGPVQKLHTFRICQLQICVYSFFNVRSFQARTAQYQIRRNSTRMDEARLPTLSEMRYLKCIDYKLIQSKILENGHIFYEIFTNLDTCCRFTTETPKSYFYCVNLFSNFSKAIKAILEPD